MELLVQSSLGYMPGGLGNNRREDSESSSSFGRSSDRFKDDCAEGVEDEEREYEEDENQKEDEERSQLPGLDEAPEKNYFYSTDPFLNPHVESDKEFDAKWVRTEKWLAETDFEEAENEMYIDLGTRARSDGHAPGDAPPAFHCFKCKTVGACTCDMSQ